MFPHNYIMVIDEKYQWNNLFENIESKSDEFAYTTDKWNNFISLKERIKKNIKECESRIVVVKLLSEQEFNFLKDFEQITTMCPSINISVGDR